MVKGLPSAQVSQSLLLIRTTVSHQGSPKTSVACSPVTLIQCLVEVCRLNHQTFSELHQAYPLAGAGTTLADTWTITDRLSLPPPLLTVSDPVLSPRELKIVRNVASVPRDAPPVHDHEVGAPPLRSAMQVTVWPTWAECGKQLMSLMLGATTAAPRTMMMVEAVSLPPSFRTVSETRCSPGELKIVRNIASVPRDAPPVHAHEVGASPRRSATHVTGRPIKLVSGHKILLIDGASTVVWARLTVTLKLRLSAPPSPVALTAICTRPADSPRTIS